MVANENRLCDYLKMSQEILKKNEVEVLTISLENYLDFESEAESEDKSEMKLNLKEIR